MTPRFLPHRAATAAARGALALAAALIASGVLAGSASAKVSWNRIGPVKIGMSDAQLRAKLGNPSSTSSYTIDGKRVVERKYRRQKLVVSVLDNRVGGVRTTSRAQRGPRGVHVGMRFKELRRRLRGERCNREAPLTCHIVRGSRVMSFVSRAGRVSGIGISLA